MIDDSFFVEREVASALAHDRAMSERQTAYMIRLQSLNESRQTAIKDVASVQAMSQADTEIVASLIDERDMYQALGLAHQAAMAVKDERIAQLERERSILATRCYEQARAIEKMLARREPEAPPAEPHPIITAVQAMQRGGLR